MDKQHILKLLKDRTIIDESISRCYCYRGYITPQGYGSINLPEGKFTVHRLSAWIHLDYDLSSDQQVNHSVLCVSKSCWNPDHLYIGSQQQNIQDNLVTGMHNNARKEECKRGHLFDENNTRINGKGARVCIACEKLRQQTRRTTTTNNS